MATFSKWCFIISGILLIVDSILMFLKIENPLGYSLPCPVTLLILGLGLLSSVFAQKK